MEKYRGDNCHLRETGVGATHGEADEEVAVGGQQGSGSGAQTIRGTAVVHKVLEAKAAMTVGRDQTKMASQLYHPASAHSNKKAGTLMTTWGVY